jgi:23S rRNA (guanine745-N1)-methyltransferase
VTLGDVADLLACPTCAGRDLPDSELRLDGTSLRCAQGHAYDVARQGHVNLLGRAVPRNADGPAMVAARERFLGSGAYDRVADALAGAAVRSSVDEPTVLDVGAGPGWYLDRTLAAFSAAGRAGRGVALDVSPSAVRRAARSRWTVGGVVADAWARLPVRSACVDVAVSVFAPRQPAELARVLAPGGTALVVSPLPEHLAALRSAWGLLDVEPGKQDRLSATFGEHLRPVEEVDLRYAVALDAATLHDLVAMGPNAFHRGSAEHAEAPDTVEVAVRLSTWRR